MNAKKKKIPVDEDGEELFDPEEFTEEHTKAATSIQARWKGKKARRKMNAKKKAKKPKKKIPVDEDGEELFDPEEFTEEHTKAATSIQARWKDKKARRKMNAKKKNKKKTPRNW